MAKDKKTRKDKKGRKADALSLVIDLRSKKKGKDGKKNKNKTSEHAPVTEVGLRPHPLEALNRLADSPLVAELLKVGALAAVAAVAEAGATDRAAMRSPEAARKAGKAAAAAVGTRLLKEFSSKRIARRPDSAPKQG